MLNIISMLRSVENQLEMTVAEKAEGYLREAFGLAITLESRTIDGVPQFIADQYALWSADLFGRPSLLMAPRPDAEASIDEMARHVGLVRTRAGDPLLILLFEHLAPSRRRALIARRMAFLVPMTQLFVPEVLLDLRERAPRAPVGEPETFSPTAQLVILGDLLGKDDGEGASATALARRYGVAIMSMTRAFDELEAAKLAEGIRVGRQRTLRFHASGRPLWDAAAARLQTPVRKVRTVVIPYPDRFPGRMAGESALSFHTALGRPRLQRLAVAAADWNQLVRDHGLRDTYPRDPAGAEVETWAYDPGALADQPGVVDRLSLHLSLRSHPDERVAMAAAELLDTFEWS